MQNTTFTFEDAVSKIEQLKGTPVAVEAQWDGDTQGWFLMMFVVMKRKVGIWKTTKMKSYHLGNLSLGDDIRLFQGTVPPYPEATLAKEIGEKLSEKYNIEFFFPSPIHPDDDCPQWLEKDKAINCADCDKLIIPTDSPHLPKDICYNCYRTREQNQQVKEKKPHDDGVNRFLSKGEQQIWLGYASEFKSFAISEFIEDQKINDHNKTIRVLTVESGEMKSIAKRLEAAIESELSTYEVPEIPERESKFTRIKTVVFKDQEYDLMHYFNSHHGRISKLIGTFDEIISAIEEGYAYHFYFKHGFNYRDDSFLRYVNFVKEGTVKVGDLIAHYHGILTKAEVLESVEELIKAECLTMTDDSISITALGKSIL